MTSEGMKHFGSFISISITHAHNSTPRKKNIPAQVPESSSSILAKHAQSKKRCQLADNFLFLASKTEKKKKSGFQRS